MSNNYLDLNSDVLRNDNKIRYVDGANITLVILVPIALFSNYKLTTSSGKHLEISHIVSLMYKLLTSVKGTDDLSIGFDCDRARRQDELTDNKNVKGKYHVQLWST